MKVLISNMVLNNVIQLIICNKINKTLFFLQTFYRDLMLAFGELFLRLLFPLQVFQPTVKQNQVINFTFKENKHA